MKNYFKINTKNTLVIMLLTIATTASISIIPILTKEIINNYSSFDVKTIVKYSLIYVGSIALFLFFEYLKKVMIFKHHKKYALGIKKDIMTSLLDAKHILVNDDDSKYVNIFINDIETLYDNYIYCWIELICSIISFVIYAVYMISLNASLSLVAIIACFISLFIPKIVGNKLSAKELNKSNKQEELISKLEEVLFAKELFDKDTSEAFLSRYEKYDISYENAAFELGRYQSFTQVFSGLSLYFINIVVFIFGIIMNYYGKIDIASLVAIIAYIDLISLPIRDIVYEIMTIKSSDGLIDKVSSILNMDKNTTEKIYLNDLIVNDISYKTENDFSLKEISYKFEQGKKYAIIGDNGSGKSIFLSILSGNRKADSGTIILGNKLLSPDDLTTNAFYCSKSIIFSDTVDNNVTLFGSYENSNKEFINFENDDSTNLSMGEKCKVNLSRCLASNKPIVLLDEIFANIDKESELEITKELLKSDKTMLLVTHNTSQEYLKQFDGVILFKDGCCQILR